MALAKDPTSHDHSRIGSIQASSSLYGNFLGGAGTGSSSPHHVSDLTFHGLHRFDQEHHHKTVHDQTIDTSEKANMFFHNLSMMNSINGYVFEATNYQPEEANESQLINFKAAAGSSNLLSFVQNESPPDQESYSKNSDHDGQDEYSSLWESNLNNYFVGSKRDASNGRLSDNFNCYQTATVMSNNSAVRREKEHGDQEIFGLFFNEATATIDINNIPGTQVASSCNKRQGDMGERMQALKKQCTGAITKNKPKPKIVTTSKDPQSIAAKNRRERISERLKVLQELVPNGSKVDLVTMLEKAISYVKFLQLQVKVLATDEFWPAQGGKAPEISQVKEAIDAILSSQRDRN